MPKYNPVECNNQVNPIAYIRRLKLYQSQIQPYYHYNPSRYKSICGCGNLLALDHYQHVISGDWMKKVKQAITCQLRFCPLCNHYRIINLTPQIKRVLDRFSSDGFEFVFMTLTVPNVIPNNMRSTIKEMNRSFGKMLKFKEFKQFHGWIRTLEVTYNHDQEAHPHFHCIFVCDKSYFKKSNPLFINAKNGDLSRLWSKACKSDQGLICDLRKIKPNGKGKGSVDSAITELAKYITKSSDIKKLDPEWFAIVDEQIKGLRFIATSQNIKLNEDQEQEISDSEWELIFTVLHKWDRAQKDYIEARKIVK